MLIKLEQFRRRGEFPIVELPGRLTKLNNNQNHKYIMKRNYSKIPYFFFL